MELEQGVTIEVREQKYKTKPAKVKIVAVNEGTTTCSIIITEGKRRQVRLMFLEVGHKVLELERVRIGKLMLDNLKPGEYRELAREELELLMK